MSTRLGRPTVAIVLSDEERETLERSRRPTTAQALAPAAGVLAAAAGQANTEISVGHGGKLLSGGWTDSMSRVPARPARSATSWWKR